MRILLVNNTYSQPGGEDVSAAQTVDMLCRAGHEVIVYNRSNSEAFALDRIGKLGLPARMIWARDTTRDLRALIRQHRPEIAHFHNTHFMISPSAYHACRLMGVPIVQTLKNYRLMCPSSNFFRDGHICEDCMRQPLALPGIVHACYRDSRAQTAAVAAVAGVHHLLGTLRKSVAEFTTMTEFGRAKFVEAGIIHAPINVIPHCIDPDPGAGTDERDDFLLFAGRLAPEKGIETLLRAFAALPDIRLKLAGDGPLLAAVRARNLPNVDILGGCDRASIFALMKRARALVFTSEWYETFGLVLAEAFACATPVIASRLGTAAELVADSVNGLHFTAGDVGDLAAKVRWAWDHPGEMRGMGQQARLEYEAKYTVETHYSALIKVYERVRDGAQ